MPFECVIDRDRRLVQTTWTGELGFEDVRAYFEKLNQDPHFEPSFDQLCDFRQVSKWNLTFDALNVLRDFDPFSANSKRAMVAPGDVAYGLGRMYEAIKGGGFVVFREMSPARTWLGLESAEKARGSGSSG